MVLDILTFDVPVLTFSFFIYIARYNAWTAPLRICSLGQQTGNKSKINFNMLILMGEIYFEINYKPG